jgi:hypothetical protein
VGARWLDPGVLVYRRKRKESQEGHEEKAKYIPRSLPVSEVLKTSAMFISVPASSLSRKIPWSWI